MTSNGDAGGGGERPRTINAGASIGAFESPFLPLIDAVAEDHLFGDDVDDDAAELEDEEEDGLIAQQLRLQQQLQWRQQEAVAEQRQRQAEAEAEQQTVVDARLQELERLRLETAVDGAAAGPAAAPTAGEEDDVELTAEELQQLLDAREADETSSQGAADDVEEDLGASRLTSLPRKSLSRSGRPTSEAARQGQRIREARAATKAAEEDVLYWTNRVKMLKHEMDKTIVKIEEARRLNNITEVSTMLNDRTREALEEHRLYQTRLVESRRVLNRQRRQELRERRWQARLGVFEENWGTREQLKQEQENNQRIMGQLRWEELQSNIRRKEEVQQQKMTALMRRVQDRAEKEQEAHRRFEERISKTKQKEEQKTQEALALIKESAVLMQHLQALKQEHLTVAGRVDPNLMALSL